MRNGVEENLLPDSYLNSTLTEPLLVPGLKDLFKSDCVPPPPLPPPPRQRPKRPAPPPPPVVSEFFSSISTSTGTTNSESPIPTLASAYQQVTGSSEMFLRQLTGNLEAMSPCADTSPSTSPSPIDRDLSSHVSPGSRSTAPTRISLSASQACASLSSTAVTTSSIQILHTTSDAASFPVFVHSGPAECSGDDASVGIGTQPRHEFLFSQATSSSITAPPRPPPPRLAASTSSGQLRRQSSNATTAVGAVYGLDEQRAQRQYQMEQGIGLPPTPKVHVRHLPFFRIV
ncbi:unnamed protein product [Protopolystoma xenopodis]|uniref:Uncharacterized protein n=1 Tax=Protopolystoma xenopodis TaxID=117903 RepID=A0A448WGJ9_9PLAT|nr:unnamed protein product [Protopolystoma xenopodis]